MRLDEALKEATNRLRLLPDGQGRRDATLLMMAAIGEGRDVLYREPERILTDAEKACFFSYIKRRSDYEPVSHILGKRDFWNHQFRVSSDVLDPRPDSETLIEAVLAHYDGRLPPDTILDLGTGSGCLLLTLLDEFEQAEGTGVDISLAALDVAKANADILTDVSRVQFKQSRWFEAVEGRFDLVISNPPYIETSDIELLQKEVRAFEPHLALDGGRDGLDCYRQIISNVIDYMVPKGFLIFEIGQGQEQVVGDLMTVAGFGNLRQYTDLSSIVRCVGGEIKNDF